MPEKWPGSDSDATLTPLGSVVIWSRSVGSADGGEGAVRDAVAYCCSRAGFRDAVLTILDACRGSDSDLLMMGYACMCLVYVVQMMVQKKFRLAQVVGHVPSAYHPETAGANTLSSTHRHHHQHRLELVTTCRRSGTESPGQSRTDIHEKHQLPLRLGPE